MSNELIRKQISDYVDQNADRLISELQRFLRQPSVSTVNYGMEECVDMLMSELTELGLNAQVLKIDGAFPAVLAMSDTQDEGKKRLFIYNHYDVQDPDPVDKWTSDPFSADIRDGHVYARGATDDKGNLYANIKALETLKAVLGSIPKGVKLFIEGEEEVGSPNLEAYLSRFADILQADAAASCDRGVHESGRPQMYLGCKGLMRMEIRCRRAKRDVHSGQAPLIPNAAWDLIRLLNSMVDENNRVIVPSYTDGIVPPKDSELALIKTIPMDAKEYKEEYQIDRINGAPADSDNMVETLLYHPTCNISGFKSGWTGERAKTIIPCEAMAKMDWRLIEGLTPETAAEKVLKFIKESPYGEFEVELGHGVMPYKVSPEDEFVKTACEMARIVYGEDPVVWPYLDGTGPFGIFHNYIGGDIINIGLGAPFSTANTHAPDENISIHQYLTGIKYMASLIYEYLNLT